MALYKAPASTRQHVSWSSEEGQAHLAAVGVAGEHEVHAAMGQDVIGVIRLMREQNHGLGRHRLARDGSVQIGDILERTACTGQPEPAAAALEGKIAVDKRGDPVELERIDHHGPANQRVMIAKRGEAMRALDTAENFRARIAEARTDVTRQWSVSHEVSGQDNNIGLERVDAADDLADEIGLGDAVGTSVGVVSSTIAQDTLITQEYILSRPMLEKIEAQLPVREWFGRDSIDFMSRFDPEKPIEKALRYWKRRVSIDVESASGIMSLEVEAFDPEESLAIARAILNESEQMLNDLSMRARQDALAESRRELKIAEDRVAKLETAQTDLRNREGVLDAQKSNETNLKLVSELRTARINLAVQLAIGQRDLGPEARRIIDIKQQMKDIDDNIARIGRQSTGMDPNQKRQLASALTRFEALEHARKEAEKCAEEVRKSYDRARILVSRQAQFLNLITVPVKADSATEPRRVHHDQLDLCRVDCLLRCGDVCAQDDDQLNSPPAGGMPILFRGSGVPGTR